MTTTTALTAESRRHVFNKIAYQVIDYLESLDHVADIRFESEQGLSRHEVVMWEKLNYPYKLPQDLREIYELFNGFTLSWSVNFQGRRVPVGMIRMSSAKQFTRLALEKADLEQIDQEVRNLSGKNKSHPNQPGVESNKSAAAFLLESHQRIGQIAVLFGSARGSTAASRSSQSDHQVWLQDPSGEWRPIASSFRDYFRLMIVHLGILGWQHVFTPAGVDRHAEQWMRLYCPERLAVGEAGRGASPLHWFTAQEVGESEGGQADGHDGTSTKGGTLTEGPIKPSESGTSGRSQLFETIYRGADGGVGAGESATVSASPARPRTAGGSGRTGVSASSSSRASPNRKPSQGAAGQGGATYRVPL